MKVFTLSRMRHFGAMTCLVFLNSHIWAANEVSVFPVKGFFRDNSAESTLDPRFLEVVESLGVGSLAEVIFTELNTALKSKVGPLSSSTAGKTFAVSFHVTRASSYLVDKGNGNSDLVASVTASLYFTNVLTGEILTNITDTVVGRAVISNKSQISFEKATLFTEQLNKVMAVLVDDAARNFNPVVVDIKITDKVGSLLILDSGYLKGVQVGDMLNDSVGQLIKVVYAGENYAVAQIELADNAGIGAVFKKYMSHASDGKVKPRTVVLVEALPEKFSKEYISQMFSDALGSRAPLSMIQVNPGFSSLLQTVIQQASLSLHDTARRVTPDLFIRLRVAEPIIYEAGTNLDFKTVRHYETLAFADVVDTSGRVNFSAIGKDVINDEITRNIGPGITERREVSVKNALTDLANQMAKISDLRRDHTDVRSGVNGDIYVSGSGKNFSLMEKGIILRKTKVKLENTTQQVWLPIAEASVDAVEDPNQQRLGLLYSFDANSEKLNAGDVFEVQRLGATPRSMQTYVICGPFESLGTVVTPSLEDLANHALGAKMPGMLYVPTVIEIGNNLIGPLTGFSRKVKWTMPHPSMCVQPVERVTAGEDVCTAQCERPITARYTLRVKSGIDIVSRTGLEVKFHSTGFYTQNTKPDQLKQLINADLIDEAQVLLEKIASNISFTSK